MTKVMRPITICNYHEESYDCEVIDKIPMRIDGKPRLMDVCEEAKDWFDRNADKTEPRPSRKTTTQRRKSRQSSSRVGRGARATVTANNNGSNGAKSRGLDPKMVREWALDTGLKGVNTLGKLQTWVLDAYEAANPKKHKVTASA